MCSIPPKTPLYQHIKDFIQAHIASGDWPAGSPVPSEAALMAQFVVARMTVNRALRELADQGMVTRIKGSGTVVAQLHKISSRLELRDIHEEILARGHTHSTRVIQVVPLTIDAAAAAVTQLAVGEQVFHSIMVHSENGMPIQYEDRYVNPVLVPHYCHQDFQHITPTHYLLAQTPITAASYILTACLPTASQAKELNITPSAPCLMVLRRTASSGQWASVARLLYPASRYHFEGQFQA